MADIKQLYQKAAQLFHSGKIKDANKIYKKILKLAPNFIDAINMYGITLAELGELPSSTNQFTKIIKLDPENINAYENLARVHMQMQKYSLAQAQYEKALALAPTSYNLYYGLASSQMAQANYEDALEAFNKAKKINDADHSLSVNIGTVLTQLGRSDEAIASFLKAISIDPTSSEPYIRLGQLYAHVKNYEKAEEILCKACQIQDNDYRIHLTLADTYQYNSNYDLALKHYFIADKIQPKSQDIYTKLDKIILHIGCAEKTSILNNLTKEYVYEDWYEAIDNTRKLAELTNYPDEDALNILRKFFEKYEPQKLNSRDWWEHELNLFGDIKYGHDKLLRGIHSAVFSWSLPDKETLTSISKFIKGSRLYSYGAGSALWERLLSDHFAADVIATDFKPRHSFMPVITEDYSTSIISEDDCIFLSWILRGDSGVLNILNQFTEGQKLILVGEPRDEHGIARICATQEFYNILDSEFTLYQSIPLVSFSMLNDTVSLYIKD